MSKRSISKENSEIWLTVFYESENMYSVIKDPTNKLKNSKQANIQNEDGTWSIAQIVFRGTEKKCAEYGARKYLNINQLMKVILRA